MQTSYIDKIDDERLIPYRDVRKTNLTRWSPWFIAEGAWVVERLIDSQFTVESVLVSERKIARVESFVPNNVRILIAPESMLNSLVGFEFHNGVMACGIRSPVTGFDELLNERSGSQIIVACPATTLPDNLGSIIRISAALGANAVAVDHKCADPFSRRVLRVSMGNAFKLPIIETNDLMHSILELQHNHGFEVVGTVLDQSAISLKNFNRQEKMVLLMGNEGHGLSDAWIQKCNRCVTIPMHQGVDSLNVADALAIFMYELMGCN